MAKKGRRGFCRPIGRTGIRRESKTAEGRRKLRRCGITPIRSTGSSRRRLRRG